MLRRILFLAMLAASMEAQAQDAPAPLTKEQILSATTGERLSMPMPGELFAALNKRGKPDWSAYLRKPASNTFTNRQQLALNLGGLVADGYLAVEAQDAQQLKNIAREIRAIAKSLSVDEELVNRSSNIVEFADNGSWDTLLEELDAVQNEVANAMVAHGDQDLVTLVLLGGWVRGTQVVTLHLSKNYTPEGALVLRQPAVVDYFVKKLGAMPQRIVDTDLMKSVRTSLFDIRKAVTYNVEHVPTLEDVKKLNELATAVVTVISTKEK